jgi:hypothetical protein
MAEDKSQKDIAQARSTAKTGKPETAPPDTDVVVAGSEDAKRLADEAEEARKGNPPKRD